jgi:hypothetical protein
MTDRWTMRPTWDDATDLEDWVVLRNGVSVGRICRRRLVGGTVAYAWFMNRLFTINANAQGRADTLDEAKAGFRRAWECGLQRHGIEKLEAALDPDAWRAYQNANAQAVGGAF